MGKRRDESPANAAERWRYVGAASAAALSVLWAVLWLLDTRQRLAPARCAASAPAAVVQFVAGRRLTARRQRAAAGRCPHCGYSLTGNASGTCPECGAAIPKGVTP